VNEFHYFQTPVYREERPEWVSHVLKNADRYYAEQKKTNKENNMMWPVTQTVHMGNDPELFFLSDYFAKTATELLRQQGYFIDPFEFYTSCMWGQEIEKNGMHEPHVHANAQMCGLFFLEAPEGGSFPIFSDPRPAKAMAEFMMVDSEVRLGTPKIYFNNMVPGTFMFFNSWLPHQFSINQSDRPTKFIHFTLNCKERLN
jgi:uncharacterized protein (TIGR02466 family)